MNGSFGTNAEEPNSHELTVVCCCCRRHCCLWTVLLATGFITKTFCGNHFSFFAVLTSPACMVYHGAFIFHIDIQWY